MTNQAQKHPRRIASNEVTTSEGQSLTRYVIELREDSTVCDLYPLTQELSFTEWIQGRLEVRNENGCMRVYNKNKLIKY